MLRVFLNGTQLHADNLAVGAEHKPELGPAPASATVLGFMKAQGLLKRSRRGPVHSPGAQAAELRFETREMRSYENPHVSAESLHEAYFLRKKPSTFPMSI